MHELVVKNTEELDSNVYAFTRWMTRVLDRKDLAEPVYLISSLMTFFSSLLFPYIREPIHRKLYSIIMSLIIQFHYGGATAFIAQTQWIGAFLMVKIFPPRLGMYMSTFFGFLILALR